MRRLKNRQLVLVRWGDAWSNSRWAEAAEVGNDKFVKPAGVSSIGWVIYSNRTGILIASRLDTDDGSGIGNTQFIPRGMLLSVKVIRA